MKMQVDPRFVLQEAKRCNWEPERLALVFKGMPLDVVARLLNGSAIITEVNNDGSFRVYVATHS